MYEHDHDTLEDILYHRLQDLWAPLTDAMKVFDTHCSAQQLCAQKVWEALLTAFPLDHKRMQTVLLAREIARMMRESVLFIGTQFSNLYTAVDTPARGRVGVAREIARMMRWDGDSKGAVNRHFDSVTELHRTMGYIGNLCLLLITLSVTRTTRS